ncbi:LysR family transcriptional regulator [Lederbergia wuyishanensis]|uniref:DNA-binding transcriptional LysR family regulator n=1 Tax=Lederbergia wuyishanensis TaxID=1347903 RepID=A0ABU0D850_9BACI|nr:LysR family transcriptional regulator [Lederbergia wuyishanensis]MCJ8009349.1 LysR family transcriptional regulator [Lederbergia wuyishanensis]MDQ0344516.1 DNA-binding transcriptional LysR family regulator [Lederbergia wuyishanensis]
MASKLDLYKIFCVVGKRKSFSQAAKELYMTQPAVSQAIMQLERELDTRLFNRTPKGVSLTDEGTILFEYANSAINLIEAGEEKLLEFKNLTAGELKIGVGDTISRHFLLPYLEAFHNHYPNIKFKMVNGTTTEICTLLKSGEVDIGVCNFPLEDPALELKPCIDIHDIFVCGEKFKYLLSKPLSLEELVKLPLIMLEPKSNSRMYVEDYLISKGIKMSPEFELGSHDLLLEFAKINLGIACVTKEFSLKDLEERNVWKIPVIEEIPSRSIGVCYLKSVPLSPASNKFVKIIENK